MDLEKEIKRLKEVMGKAEVREKGKEVFELAKAYLSDAEYFLEKNMKEEALEAYAIAWAYLDALLHFGFAKVPREFLYLFT